MEQETRTITVEQFIEAIARGGYIQGKGFLFNTKNNKVQACALGIGFLNTGTRDGFIPNDSEDPLFTELIKIYEGMDTLVSYTVSLNDRQGKTPEQIARALRKKFKKDLKVQLTLPKVNYHDYLNDWKGIQV